MLSGIVGKQSEFTLDYDILITAIGAETATYGTPGVKENTYFLKDIYDAQRIRANIMDHLETAAYPGQGDAEVSRLLHFVVVGGGPTGKLMQPLLFLEFLNCSLLQEAFSLVSCPPVFI